MPAIAVWLLRLAARLTPSSARVEFITRWHSRLVNLWILVERGELPIDPRTETLWLLRAAFSNAFWMRFSRIGLRNWLRGPSFILTTSAIALLLLALFSRGFIATRTLIRIAIAWQTGPRRLPYDARGDLVVAHLVPLVMAICIGIALVVIGRLTMGHCGWRYWTFLSAKLVAVLFFVPLLWTEGGALLWRGIAQETLRAWIVGIGSTLVFFAGFGMAVIWAFSDQRCRCPVCLRRLAQPVTFGSWASIFEPATTEFVCEEGHGSLSLAESEMGEGDRWVALDASWRGL